MHASSRYVDFRIARSHVSSCVWWTHFYSYWYDTGTTSMSVNVGWRNYYNLHRSVRPTEPVQKDFLGASRWCRTQEGPTTDQRLETSLCSCLLKTSRLAPRSTHIQPGMSTRVSSCLSDELRNPGRITRSLLKKKKLHSHTYVPTPRSSRSFHWTRKELPVF